MRNSLLAILALFNLALSPAPISFKVKYVKVNGHGYRVAYNNRGLSMSEVPSNMFFDDDDFREPPRFIWGCGCLTMLILGALFWAAVAYYLYEIFG